MKKLIHSAICVILIFVLALLCGCEKTVLPQTSQPGTASSVSSETSENLQAENSSVSEIPSTDATENSSSVGVHESSKADTTSQEVYSGVSSRSETQSSVLPETPAKTSSDKTSSVAVHTHSWTSRIVAAKCTEKGYTLKTCACGESNKTDYTAALGHSWGGWTTVKAATVTSEGRQERICAACKNTESRSVDKLTDTADNVQQEILRLVNAERAKAGLSPLAYYTAGQAAADTRAEEIGEVFSHTRPDGSSCFTVFEEHGLSYRAVGENIAYGYRTAESVMEGWMNSEGHRANILNGNFTHIVVGVNGTNWVQLFITPYSR